MTVSVLMPCRNRLPQLQLALPTVIQQNPDEIIAVDDGSTDGTSEFLKAQPVVYVRREREKYTRLQAETWNLCAERATGDVFIWQNAEIFHPGDSYRRLLERLEPGSIAFGCVYDCSMEHLPSVDCTALLRPDWEMSHDGQGKGGSPPKTEGCTMYCGPERPMPWLFLGAMHRETWNRAGPFPPTGKTDVGFARQALAAGIRFLGAGGALGIHLSHGRNGHQHEPLKDAARQAILALGFSPDALPDDLKEPE